MRAVVLAAPAHLAAHATTGACGETEVIGVELREGVHAQAVREAVAVRAADVVVVIGPERLPAGALDGLDVPRLAYDNAPREAHDPFGALRVSHLEQFDRVACTDPLAAAAAEAAGIGVWRCAPLPVADALFAETGERAAGRIAFAGASTEHREEWLTPSKHHHDLLHVAHGERTAELLRDVSVAIGLRREPGTHPESELLAHLAAGRLLLTEPLGGAFALEPGIDHLELPSPWALADAIGALREDPSLHETVRLRGRLRAETFRASRVWPRLVADLRRDVAAVA